MESNNAILIGQGRPQSERLIVLHDLAVPQMQTMDSLNMSSLSRIGMDK